jgi:hypothetical protein
VVKLGTSCDAIACWMNAAAEAPKVADWPAA